MSTCRPNAVVSSSKKQYLSHLEEYAASHDKYAEMAEQTLDLSELERHNYVIKSDYDPRLRKLADQISAARDGRGASPQISPIYWYCFRLTKNDSRVISNKRKYIELGTVNFGVYFTTTKLKNFVMEYQDPTQAYSQTQSGLVKKVVSIASTYSPVLELLNGVLAHLDVILRSPRPCCCKCPEVYAKPTIFEKGTGDLVFKDVRHPCLEVQDDMSFIPNDVEMVKDKSEFQIITGPNMGGRSTYIRQGLSPSWRRLVHSYPVRWLNYPFRLGFSAGDSQLKGISTFMAEMLETATILKTPSSSSMSLEGELPPMTDPGWPGCISEKIASEIHAFCLFATRFHELTALDQELSHVKTLHVVAHVPDSDGQSKERDITLRYKVEPGVSDQSFGIHVARMANFPEPVIRLADR
ncbi:muts domain V-domain-containing protein [Russula brevipes]|nr:muts domain V-domain-containing protein [Russula brevipes]